MNNPDFTVRSDLALECAQRAYKDKKPDDDGVEMTVEETDGIRCDSVVIKDERGAKKLGKPIGRYITLNVGKIWELSEEELETVCSVCADKLLSLFPEDARVCLLACLGNRSITADAQGPICAENFTVTRHIRQQNPRLFRELSLFETACIVPDVLGNTGIESAQVVKAVARIVKPDFVIASDSLAARKASRVATTIQISNVGITPGSGIGNHRTALSQDTLGVPVIAIGIPTVVDAATLGADVLEEYFALLGEAPEEIDGIRDTVLARLLQSGNFSYFLTPKEADRISGCAGKITARSVELALERLVESSEDRFRI